MATARPGAQWKRGSQKGPRKKLAPRDGNVLGVADGGKHLASFEAAPLRGGHWRRGLGSVGPTWGFSQSRVVGRTTKGAWLIRRAGLGCSSYGGVAPRVGDGQLVRVFGLVLFGPTGREDRKAAGCVRGSCRAAEVGGRRLGGGGTCRCKPRGLKPPSQKLRGNKPILEAKGVGLGGLRRESWKIEKASRGSSLVEGVLGQGG